MLKEIQEWIDCELKARETKPFIYQGNFIRISDGWLDGLRFALNNQSNVKEKFESLNVDLANDYYGYGYYNALKTVLEK